MLKLRKATVEDIYFVRSSFFTSIWKKNLQKTMDWTEYGRTMDQYVGRLLNRSSCLVAYFEEAPNEVLGYLIHEGETAHWCYVRGYARRQGIATGLVTGRVSFYTHQTDAQGRKFAESAGLKYNPLLLLESAS